jgi:uncharacterized lipoprotein YajG
MKKRLLQLFAILLFTACQKEISMDKASEKIAGVDENKQAKILYVIMMLQLVFQKQLKSMQMH